MATTLTINATSLTAYLALGWTVQRTLNGIGVFTGEILSADGVYHMDLDHLTELIDTTHGVILFGGPVTSFVEHGVGNVGRTAFQTRFTAHDFNAYASRRFITLDIAAGTLKAALTAIVGYITPGGLHPSQVDGPSLPALSYVNMKGVDVLNDLSILSGGWLWNVNDNQVLRMEAPTTNAAPFNIVAGVGCKAVGDITVEPTRENYANRVLVRSAVRSAEANDVAEQTAHGYWETLVTVPDVTSQVAMQSMADMILAQSLPILNRVSYKTREYGLKVGDIQTITVSQRGLSNTFLITDITTRSVPRGLLEYEVIAIEGSAIQATWRDTYKQWGSGSGGSTVVGGGTGGTSATRFAYYLGGNGIDATSSPTPTWVPAAGGGAIGQGAIVVQIDTVTRGTTAATIVARLRALDAGVSVSARLYDITAAAPCAGTSSVVTSTSWQTVSWGVTLTAGAHLYELQLLPTVANAPVLGTAYLE
jgi:hypothetical protein